MIWQLNLLGTCFDRCKLEITQRREYCKFFPLKEKLILIWEWDLKRPFLTISNSNYYSIIINFFENENIKIIKNNRRFDVLSFFRNNILSVFPHSFQRIFNIFSISFLFFYFYMNFLRDVKITSSTLEKKKFLKTRRTAGKEIFKKLAKDWWNVSIQTEIIDGSLVWATQIVPRKTNILACPVVRWPLFPFSLIFRAICRPLPVRSRFITFLWRYNSGPV